MVTQEQMDEQRKKDKKWLENLTPEYRAHLRRQVEIIRAPSHTNFSDPEAL